MPSNEAPQEKRIAVTLTADQAKRLREVSAAVDLSTGLLSRALVEYGLDHVEDDGVQAAIASVRQADRDRRARVGRKVMEKRWQEQEEPDKKKE